MLLGHSWGAYCAGSVLNLHPDVKAVAMLSGFNASTDIIMVQGKTLVGDAIGLFKPYIYLYEFMKFGACSQYDCEGGFGTSAAGIMIIHSMDDDTVPPEVSYATFKQRHKDDERFVFAEFEDHGHERIFYSDDARRYRESFNNSVVEHTASLDTELMPEMKIQYINETLDKKQYYELDMNLMYSMLAFFNKHL